MQGVSPCEHTTDAASAVCRTWLIELVEIVGCVHRHCDAPVAWGWTAVVLLYTMTSLNFPRPTKLKNGRKCTNGGKYTKSTIETLVVIAVRARGQQQALAIRRGEKNITTATASRRAVDFGRREPAQSKRRRDDRNG